MNGSGEHIALRPATVDDFDQIVEIWRLSGLRVAEGGRDSREAFARQVARFGSAIQVAVVAERVVGVVFGTHDERKGWINRLAVLPAYRRRGIAEALVKTADTELRRAGMEIVAALVEPESPASAALFQKLGFLTDVPALYFRKLTRDNA